MRSPRRIVWRSGGGTGRSIIFTRGGDAEAAMNGINRRKLVGSGAFGLADALYAPFGVKPFMGGNTGVSMGGWFRHPIDSLDHVKGLKVRMLGLGGEVFRRLGATPQTTPPGEIFTSLQSGVIDGAEFVGP